MDEDAQLGVAVPSGQGMGFDGFEGGLVRHNVLPKMECTLIVHQCCEFQMISLLHDPAFGYMIVT
jgi:hypothetical protein